MDWFILLTPILLLPIALLFFFVGCSLLYKPADVDEKSPEVDDMNEDNDLAEVRFQIRFFPGTDRLSNIFKFKIVVNQVDAVEVDGTADSQSFGEVTFGFTELMLPGTKTMFCEVFDLTDPSPQDAPLVRRAQQGCTAIFEANESYEIQFRAGENPSNRFLDGCEIDQTS